MQVNIGKGIELQIDHTALPQSALDHVIYIGLRNILMDCHASVTEKEYPDSDERNAVAQSMAEKKLAALMAGEVRVSSSREGDPVRAEAKRMAMTALKAKLKKAGKKAEDYTKEALAEAAAKLITDDVLAEAKRRVEANRAVAGDLADLGL